MTSDPLQELLENAVHYDLFQAIRLLERLRVEKLPVGMGETAADEVVQFRQAVSLSPASSPIRELQRHDDRMVMLISAMGLLAPGGVLPLHYTTLALREQRETHRRNSLRDRPGVADAGGRPVDPTSPGPFGDYLDLITHRLVALWYRAWERANPLVGFERSWFRRGAPLRHPVRARVRRTFLGEAVGSMLGLPAEGADVTARAAAAPVSHEPLLALAGMLVYQPRTPWAVQQTLSSLLGLTVKLRSFQGGTRRAARGQCTQLSMINCRLTARPASDRAWLARRVAFPQERVVIDVGTIGWAAFVGLLPCEDADSGEMGASFRKAKWLVRFQIGQQVQCDLATRVPPEEVVPVRLGRAYADAGVRLGWSSWIGRPKDPSQCSRLFALVPAS